jgi:hypothetical protein
MGLPTKKPTERALLLEIVLILTLVIGGMVFYWRPAASGELIPRWWHWMLLGVLFFAIAGLHTWRARRRSHRVLHDVIRQDAGMLRSSGQVSGAREAHGPNRAPPSAGSDRLHRGLDDDSTR